MQTLLTLETDFFEQNERDLTVFEIRSCTKILLRSIKSEIAKDIETIKIKICILIDQILKKQEVVSLLTQLRHLDDYTFEHSSNVCTLSMLTACLMNYDDISLLELGEGALLHDVGKILVSENVLKKPSKLTDDEYEEIKLHAKLGFETICECDSLSKNVAYIANTHHERMNGKGYPQGLVGNQIKEVARIVAIADVYDALVSDRVYRSKMLPGEVLDYIVLGETGYFDEEIMQVFKRFLAVFPVGTHVLLSNNCHGIVLKDNIHVPYKPLVKMFGKQTNVDNNSHLDSIIDLSENTDIYISKELYKK